MLSERKPAERTLEMVREFDAPCELVFRLWTEAEHFARWCAPAKFEIVESRIDARRGGVWWSRMRAADGEECIASGVYREVLPPARLSFTYAHETPGGKRGPETRVTVSFEPLGERTRLTLRQSVFETVADCAAHRFGWSDCLDRLEAWLEKTEASA